jgi:glycosyltransferase involved in cell wall biosynthesis
MTRPRILHVIDDARLLGGAQTYLHGLAAALTERGWANGLLARQGEESGTFEWRASLAQSSRAAVASARSFEPNVILLHTLDTAGVARALASTAPTFLYEHDYRHISPGNLRFFQRSESFCDRGFGLRCLVKPYTERCNNRRPDRVARSIARVLAWRAVWPQLAGVLCATQFVERLLVDEGVPPNSISVVGYFGDPPAAMFPSAHPRGDILFVGRTSPVKGVHYLLRAFAGIAEQLPAATVQIVGGPRTAALEQLASSLGIRDRVEFRGWLTGEALEDAYGCASVFVLPSVWPEAFGIAGLEAQFRGLPVVAFDVGGISEWLDDGRTGYLVPARDAVALGDAVAHVLTNPERAREMGSLGSVLARERFSRSAHVDRLLNVLAGGSA